MPTPSTCRSSASGSARRRSPSPSAVPWTRLRARWSSPGSRSSNLRRRARVALGPVAHAARGCDRPAAGGRGAPPCSDAGVQRRPRDRAAPRRRSSTRRRRRRCSRGGRASGGDGRARTGNPARRARTPARRGRRRRRVVRRLRDRRRRALDRRAQHAGLIDDDKLPRALGRGGARGVARTRLAAGARVQRPPFRDEAGRTRQWLQMRRWSAVPVCSTVADSRRRRAGRGAPVRSWWWTRAVSGMVRAAAAEGDDRIGVQHARRAVSRCDGMARFFGRPRRGADHVIL